MKKQNNNNKNTGYIFNESMWLKFSSEIMVTNTTHGNWISTYSITFSVSLYLSFFNFT